MTKILLQENIPLKLLDAMIAEFPQYTFVQQCETPSDWHSVEIIYGDTLTEEELEHAPRLKWVHSPTTNTDKLCLDQLHEKNHILLSMGGRFDVTQIGEYVMGGILACSKQFFKWQMAPTNPEEFRDWPLKENLWTLREKLILQIGLGRVGTEIVRLASLFGMKAWGIRTRRSFHPYCHKTFSLNELHSLLPYVDVISVAIPRRRLKEPLFSEDEFRLMKRDSIFILTGSADPIDEIALAKVACEGKFRGVILDAFNTPLLPKDSPLRAIPDCLLTPNVSSLPQRSDFPSVKLFLRNLRIYLTGKYQEMKHLVGIDLLHH